MNLKIGLFLIGLMIASFAFVPMDPIRPISYPIKYVDSINVDGKGTDWSQTKTYLYTDSGASSSYFEMAYTYISWVLLYTPDPGLPEGTMKTYYLCGYFNMKDKSVDDGTGAWHGMDYFAFNYDASDADNVIKFARDGRMYDGGGNLFESTPFSYYDITESTTSWSGEFCIPYNFFGIEPGVTTSYGPSLFRAYDYGGDAPIPEQTNYFWPQTTTTRLTSTVDKFDRPANWCYINSDCADTEYCNANACTEVTGTCGYAENHAWVSYACCADTDCMAGRVCSSHTCVLANACTSNSDCANDQYCAPAAAGDQCLAVPTESCGYVSNHAWHDYECCSNNDCSGDDICSSHECVSGDVCEGDVTLDVDKLTATNISAEIGGLDNCQNVMGYIRKESCSGQLACSVELDSNGGNCIFSLPNQNGWYTYVACVDIDDDGSYTNDEKATVMLEVNKTCVSTGCTATQWGECSCQGAAGVQTGTCIDNCGTTLTQTKPCTCTVVQPPNNTVQTGQNGTSNNPPQEPPTADKVGKPDYLLYAVIGLGAIFAITIITGLVLMFGKKPPAPKVPEKTEPAEEPKK